MSELDMSIKYPDSKSTSIFLKASGANNRWVERVNGYASSMAAICLYSRQAWWHGLRSSQADNRQRQTPARSLRHQTRLEQGEGGATVAMRVFWQGPHMRHHRGADQTVGASQWAGIGNQDDGRSDPCNGRHGNRNLAARPHLSLGSGAYGWESMGGELQHQADELRCFPDIA